MKNVIVYLLMMNRFSLIISVLPIVFLIVMIIVHKILVVKDKRMTVWRLSCFVPLILCVIHFMIFSFKENFSKSISQYIYLYIGAAAIVIWQFFANKKIAYCIATVIVGAGTIIGMAVGVFMYTMPDNIIIIGNHSRDNYVKNFEGIMNDMKENYVLNDWKDIDYNKLSADIMPKVKEAQKNHDPVAYYKALTEYVNNFRDGHVSLEIFNDKMSDVYLQANKEMSGNDYGFSMFTVSTGETIAILVEDDSQAAIEGISDGTVITKWNGIPIEEAIDSANYILCTNAPVMENEEMYRAIYFAGMGEESVEVTFFDENGLEKTVKVDKIGDYYARRDKALSLINNQYFWDSEKIANMSSEDANAEYAKLLAANENFQYRMVSDTCGYLMVNSEEYDKVGDVKAEIKGDYPEIIHQWNNK